MKLYASTIIFLLTISTSGCIMLPIPHDAKLSPRHQGVVIDVETGKPIEGAKVTVNPSPAWVLDNNENPITNYTHTDQKGEFDVVVTKREMWVVLYMGPAEGGCGSILTIEHPSYKTREIKSFEMTSGGSGVCSHVEFSHLVELESNGI